MLKRLRVLRHILCVEMPNRVDEFLPILRRVRDGKNLVCSIDLDRADVELELRVSRFEKETHDAAYGHGSRHDLEVYLDPLAEFALRENDLTVADDYLGDGVLRVDEDLKIKSDLLLSVRDSLPRPLLDSLVVLEVVRRPGEFRIDDAVHYAHGVDLAARDIVRAGPRIGRVERERSVRPEDVRCAHSRHAPRRTCLAWHGREVRRDFEDRARDSDCLKHLPERNAPSQVHRAAPGQREHVVREG